MNATVPVELFWRLLSPAKRKELITQSGLPYVEWQCKELSITDWPNLGAYVQEAILNTLNQAADNLARHRI